MKDKIIKLCKKTGADLIGFAPVSRFPSSSAVHQLMPTAKTVIGLGFRVLRGIYRGVEEGSTYYQYVSMAVDNMEETIMPMASLRLSMFLEEEGFSALPQRRHVMISPGEDSLNPEARFKKAYRNCPQETQMDFSEAAVLCGLGEIGLHGSLLTDEFGPFVRTCFVLTDAEIKATPVKTPHLCDKCGECVKGCPGKAIQEDGTVNQWQCAVYYSGSCGLKNPFMPPYAYENFEDRLEIICGEANLSPEKAKAILNESPFYAHHGMYASSICGKACDINCYVHLEKKGILTKSFHSPFRKREPWKFDVKDFEKKTK